MNFDGKCYDVVGVSAGTIDDGSEVVGIMFPKENAISEDDFDEVFLTLPAAKTLLIDLRDAIDIAIKHKSDQRRKD